MMKLYRISLIIIAQSTVNIQKPENILRFKDIIYLIIFIHSLIQIGL